MGHAVLGKMVPSASEQMVEGGLLNVTLRFNNLSSLKQYEGMEAKFKEYAAALYINAISEIHKYLLRLTPIHTGKLRGGWTAFLDKYQKDYSRQLFDTSLSNIYKKSNVSKEHKSYVFSMGAVGDGKQYSILTDKLPGELSVSISNSTPYGTALNFGTSEIPGQHFVEQALYKSDYWLRTCFDNWLQAIAKAGTIVPPTAVPEIDV
jgi:hypothetical protein